MDKNTILENLKKGKLINFYETEAVKKYMPKIKDEQKEYTGMPLNQHFLLCGGTGSGKSNSLMSYLLLTSFPKDGTFKKIFMCVKKLESFNYTLKEKLGDDIQFYLTVEEFPPVSEFPDLGKHNDNQWLIIFDDCITDGSNKKLQKKIDDYFIYGRSKGCTVCYLSQSYYQTPILVRRQLSFLLLCSINSNKELKMILKDYAIRDLEWKTLEKIYRYAKDGEFPNFLKVCTYECPQDKKFSKTFIHYINPDDFT